MLVKGKICFPVFVSASRIHGRGSFSEGKIPARKKIGDLGGVVISKRKGRQLARQKKSISLVELWNGKTLNASVASNELRFINHSCRPNTYMRNNGFLVEFYALVDIKQGEELTCNYGPTHHDGQRKCQCGMPGCKGSI